VNRGGRCSNSAATASAWFGLPMRASISFCSAAKPVSRSTRPARSSSRLAARMACGLRPAIVAGQLEGGLARIGIDPGRQAQRHGLLAAHDAAGEGQLLGHVPADELGEQLAARHVGYQAPPDLQHRHPRVRRDDPDVGAERDLQAAAERVPGDGRDDRDGNLGPDVRRALPGRPGRTTAAGRSTWALSRSPFRMAWNMPKSRPAQKSGPSPDSTTARTRGSALSRSPAATRPANIAPSSALRFSGRVSRTSATPSVISRDPLFGHPTLTAAARLASAGVQVTG
jgi:hypothetical protein